MNPDDRDQLLLRYLDGNLTAAEGDELDRLLESDADARSSLREMAMQAVSLADLAREQDLAARRTKPTPTAARPRWWSKGTLAVVVGLILLVSATTIWLSRGKVEAVTLAQLSGAVSWTAEGGQSQTGLQPGDSLRGGTLSVEGAASSAQLVFRDGTTIALCGDSELVLPSQAGKQLSLRRGSLSADVRPQPSSRPMRIRTPTAEIVVLGTRFYVSSQPVETAISVDAGKVRLRRLADERSVDVTQGQAATASLDVDQPLEAAPLPPIPSQWRQTFDQPPPSICHGKWQEANAAGPGRMRNIADFSVRRSDGTPIAAYTVNVRDKLGIATVSPDSVLRVRYRMANPRPVLILVGLHQPTGWFAGNFQTMVKPSTIPEDADGWRMWEAPLSALEASSPKDARIPDAGRVFLIYLACYSPQVQLEVAEITIEPPHSDSTPETATAQ
jgi:ferric-dicitrate binding protein FerR (iron transport regulator)